MELFHYVIKDELGIHARPAALLVKEAGKWQSSITLDNGVKKADAKKLLAIMSMGIKHGQEVMITVEGEDEADCVKSLQQFFAENL